MYINTYIYIYIYLKYISQIYIYLRYIYVYKHFESCAAGTIFFE